MSTQPVLFPVLLEADSTPLMRAVAAYLARFKDATRVHTESDLRAFLVWCSERRLSPLDAQRVHVELYVRWMQEVRRFKPSTVSRRMSVVAGFYRTCVIDRVLPNSPADYVRRPKVPPESPTLGLSHLAFEAMLAAARDSRPSGKAFSTSPPCASPQPWPSVSATVGPPPNGFRDSTDPTMVELPGKVR